ncbi:hypothetical protein [Fluviicola sp.]|uniref:hypothetical protein n=1 Tax=Fluviicola sp. TaxID=1917219 RepID=UPI0026036F26|nr:hypothetical protein [Fluviicola sp.]
MKKLKMITLVMTMLFLGMSNVDAQDKSTVIISAKTYTTGSKYEIQIIKPDYEVENKLLKGKEEDFFVSVKKEVDYWLEKGYKLMEMTANSLATNHERVLIILIKE